MASVRNYNSWEGFGRKKSKAIKGEERKRVEESEEKEGSDCDLLGRVIFYNLIVEILYPSLYASSRRPDSNRFFRLERREEEGRYASSRKERLRISRDV